MTVLVDQLPSEPLAALRELTRAEVELGDLRRRIVADARSAGASWDQIGESLGMSRQSAWEYFSRSVRDSIAAHGESSLDEEAAMRLAVEETREVRRRRTR